ncbi:MAG: saccharopine dehydrogenase NADP-binding domain-containing protein [Saprospiraceae bacterium]|jgi:saccharopine dehydrogenase-like NADP-dependent oxidoreductase|nr:saccharopine dehydrogenase NADP-binding domain-containing protein [Saprospiraceae bacterium]
MKNTKILIIGGYGGAGFPIARLLLQETSVDVVLAGRHIEKGKKAANLLNSEFDGERVEWRVVDASDTKSLNLAFDGVELVVVCSTTTSYVELVAKAAIAASIDYLDIHYPSEGVDILRSLESSIIEKNRCFITQAGFHPGLIAPFLRLPAPYLDQYTKAYIGMAMNTRNIGTPESASEIIDSFADYKAYVYKNNSWILAVDNDSRKINFGPDFGIRTCYPISFEEMKSIPEQHHIKEVGAYFAGFNWIVDYIIVPLSMMLAKVRKGLGTRFLTRLLLWGCRTFSKPPFGVLFKVEAEGIKDGHFRKVEIIASHADVYAFTAIPTVACILQYLEGGIRKPGLWLMGQVVEPQRLIKDMERMGVNVVIDVKDHN